LSGVVALGVDEIHVGRKEKFWTLVYQIDEHCKRLLWVGRDRTEKTFETFFEKFGAEFCAGIGFLCSDMWKPYLNAAARWTPAALRILDRFHIVKKLNEAIDEIRRQESRALEQAGLAPLLKKMRWAFLKRRRNWDPFPAPPHARPRRQRLAHDARLHSGGGFPALLDLLLAQLGRAFSRCLVQERDAKPP
jgi:transposase